MDEGHPRKKLAAFLRFAVTVGGDSIDDIDLAILRALQEDGRQTLAALGRQVGLSEAPVQRRLHRLRSEGWIRRFVALLDPTLLDRELTVFVNVELDPESVDGDDDIGRSLDALPEVVECHRVTGTAQYLIKVVTSDPVAFLAIDRRLAGLPGFRRASRHVSLATIKSTTELPLPERTRDLRRRQ